MKHSKILNNLPNVVLTVAFVLIFAVGLRQANAITVITFNNDTDISAASSAGANLAGLRGTVTCTLSCSGLYYTGGAYGWGDPGEMFDGPINAGDANEAIWVNSVVGTSFDGSDVAENYQEYEDNDVKSIVGASLSKAGGSGAFFSQASNFSGPPIVVVTPCQ